jgi:hypothetical protein
MPPVRYDSLTVVVGFMLNRLRLGEWYSRTLPITVLPIQTVHWYSSTSLAPVSYSYSYQFFYGIVLQQLPSHGGRTIIQ